MLEFRKVRKTDVFNYSDWGGEVGGAFEMLREVIGLDLLK